MAKNDYYRVLGVSPDSEQEVIEAAYRALMKKHHPDRGRSGPENLRRAREINEAYEVLGNPRSRQKYNQTRGGTSNLPSIWQEAAEGPQGTRVSASRAQSQEGSKRCVDCAEEIQALARVCRYCGARQDGFASREGQTTNVHTHIYTSPPAAEREREPVLIEAPRKRSGAGLAVIIGIVLLVIWLIGAVGASSGNEAENPSTGFENADAALNATDVDDTDNATDASQDGATIPEPSPEETTAVDNGSNAEAAINQAPPDEQTEQNINGM